MDIIYEKPRTLYERFVNVKQTLFVFLLESNKFHYQNQIYWRTLFCIPKRIICANCISEK